MEDLVSIIIPVYNAEKFIDETISTVLDQTYTNFELLLVNDCSTDNSEKLIKKYLKDDRIKLINNKTNSKAAISRNNGIKAAKGRYICFLDADDKWDKTKLEKQIKFMKENDCAFSYHSYEFADVNCVPTGKKVIAKEKLTYKECLKNNIISTITVMFDMNKLFKDDIYMPDYKYVEDTATWWRILRNGHTAYGIPEVFSYYRRIPNTSSSNKLRTQKSLWFLYTKEERLGLIKSIYYLFIKNVNAVLRRI